MNPRADIRKITKHELRDRELVDWYRYLLILPIVIPLIVWLPYNFRIIGRDSILVVPAIFLMGSLVLGGIPYLISAVFIFVYAREKEETVVRKLYLLYPLGMIGIFALIIIGDGLFFHKIDHFTSLWPFLPDSLYSWIIVSGFTLLFGYGYVLLTFIIIRLIRGKTFSR